LGTTGIGEKIAHRAHSDDVDRVMRPKAIT
jgi:hypothetical protein